MNQFGTILGWDFFLQAAAFLFLLDWILYVPLFRPLLAKEYGREWKAPTAGRVILTSGLWLLALGLAGFGPKQSQTGDDLIGWRSPSNKSLFFPIPLRHVIGQLHNLRYFLLQKEHQLVEQ